jgi:hypothetical protein
MVMCLSECVPFLLRNLGKYSDGIQVIIRWFSKRSSGAKGEKKKRKCIKRSIGQGVVVDSCNPSTLEAEAGGS